MNWNREDLFTSEMEPSARRFLINPPVFFLVPLEARWMTMRDKETRKNKR
jgi:hypothetical protein